MLLPNHVNTDVQFIWSNITFRVLLLLLNSFKFQCWGSTISSRNYHKYSLEKGIQIENTGGFCWFFFLLLLLVKHINFRDSVFIVCLECPWCTTIKKFKSSKDGIYYRLTKVVCSPVLFTCFLPFWLWNRMTVSKISKLWLTDHRWVNADTDSNSIQWVTIHSQHNNLSLRYRKEKKLVPTVS